MAIQINGTTVLSDSRVLSNVTGLKTVNSNSILGSGNIAIDQGPALGTTLTFLGEARGASGGGGTVTCSADNWYAVGCSSDNQGGPSSGNIGSNGCAIPTTANTSGVVSLNTCNLTQSTSRIFWASGETVVDITSNRGTYRVYRIT